MEDLNCQFRQRSIKWPLFPSCALYIGHKEQRLYGTIKFTMTDLKKKTQNVPSLQNILTLFRGALSETECHKFSV